MVCREETTTRFSPRLCDGWRLEGAGDHESDVTMTGDRRTFFGATTRTRERRERR